jgi:glycosyltransferase involved in cell wall biosynthesis
MKVLFLSTFYPFRGGIAQFNALLYREIESIHDVKAFTFTRQYPDFLFPGQTQFVTKQDKADPIPALRILDTINPFTYLKTAGRVRKENPDIVITKYWMTFFAPCLGYVLGKMKGRAVRVSILDNVVPHEKRFFDSAFNRYFLKRNDGFIVMSDKVLQDLLSVRPNARYLRIDHPVYNQFGTKMDREKALDALGLGSSFNHKILLFFGIIRDYKGLDLLIDALELLDDSYELIIAGEVYGSFAKYEEQILNKGLTGRVRLFNQYIDDEQVTTFFSAADVCVLPYRSATQSGIISIAKYFEIPVIATNVGGLKESFEHKKTGLIIKDVSPEAIKNGIEEFFESDLRWSAAEFIRKENELNSWSAFATKLIDFAKSLKK